MAAVAVVLSLTVAGCSDGPGSPVAEAKPKSTAADSANAKLATVVDVDPVRLDPSPRPGPPAGFTDDDMAAASSRAS